MKNIYMKASLYIVVVILVAVLDYVKILPTDYAIPLITGIIGTILGQLPVITTVTQLIQKGNNTQHDIQQS